MSVPADLTRIYLGGMDNLGVMTRRGDAPYDDIVSRWRATDAESRYTGITDVQYSDRFGGLILEPDVTLRDTKVADLTIQQGTLWRNCTPPALGVTCALYYDAAANPDPNSYTAQVQGGLLSAHPNVIVTVVRTKAAPDGMSPYDQRWTFAWGGVELIWGRQKEPILYDIATGAEISRLSVPDSDRVRYWDDEIQRWEIAALGGELYLSCSSISEPWVVVREVTAGAWQFAANGGKFALNVTLVRFPATGSLITPWVEHGTVYPAEDLEARTWPTNSGAVGATVAVYDSDGTRRRYQITLTSSDVYQTPILRGYDTLYRPEFDALDPDWTEISDWWKRGTEEVTRELSARTTQLEFEESAGFIGAVGRLSGHRAVTYYTGYDDGNGHTATQRRMTGILRRLQRDGHRLTMTIYDQWTRLADVRLYNPPCLLGMNRGDAIKLIAMWAGIPYESILIDAAITETIGDPSKPFKDNLPPWRIANRSTAADAIRKVCDVYNIRAAFNGAGQLLIYLPASGTVTNTYSTAEGTDRRYALGTGAFEGVTFDSDLTGARNHLVVQGKDRDGKAITASYYRPESVSNPTAENYLGYWATEMIEDADAATAQEVNAQAVRRLDTLHYGQPRCTLERNRALALMHQSPDDLISVTDADVALSARTCRIDRLAVHLQEDRLAEVTVTLEVQPDESEYSS